MIVYLWDTCDPARRGSGISDDQRQAQQAAETCLRSGQATTARVEAAFAVLGITTLESRYDRTGSGWHARRGDRGLITWEPFTDARTADDAVARQ
jgi:hypothetical protein